MSQLAQALTNAEVRNRELLSVLASTDHAAGTLQQNKSYVVDLEAQEKATVEELKRLHTITEDERKDHVKLRDSTFRRYAHKLRGSKGQAEFASKSEKEEREFLEAWQKEREAEERRADLRRSINTAIERSQRLEGEKARNASAQRDLDQLYATIFSGPTPELPGEDQLESAVQNARQLLEQTQSQCNADTAALDALYRAEPRLQAAARAVEQSLSMSRSDMMNYGNFADMMEHDALSQAFVAISEAQRHMDEAWRLQHAITGQLELPVDMRHVSDVMFDNNFSPMSQRHPIHALKQQMTEAITQLNIQIEMQLERVDSAKVAIRLARSTLRDARVELQSIRAEAFERLSGGGIGGNNAGGDAPPPYSVAEGVNGQ